MEPEGDLAQRAVYRSKLLVGQRIGRLEDEHTGLQVVILGERAAEIGRLLNRSRHVLHFVGAGRTLALQALVAPAARAEITVDDPVTLLERGTEAVGRDALAKPGDTSSHLMAEN